MGSKRLRSAPLKSKQRAHRRSKGKASSETKAETEEAVQEVERAEQRERNVPKPTLLDRLLKLIGVG